MKNGIETSSGLGTIVVADSFDSWRILKIQLKTMQKVRGQGTEPDKRNGKQPAESENLGDLTC